MKIALSAKFKYGHATPERVGERKGGEREVGPFANENSSQNGDLNAAIKTQWPAPPPPRRRRYYTHYDGRDSEKRDAGRLVVLRPGSS